MKNNSGSIKRLMEDKIFIKDKFSIINITIMEKDALDSSRSDWNSEHGLMISVPTKTREEALDISNLLMSDIIINSLK